MDLLLTQEEFNLAGSRQGIPIRCKSCGKTFYRTKRNIQTTLRTGLKSKDFCNVRCQEFFIGRAVCLPCEQCGAIVRKRFSEIRKMKHHFCSSSCAAKFRNSRKQTGTRRSKLEIWLSEKLIALYPDLEFRFNDRDLIGSELDIYIPSLKIAFELNGLFHYEPVFGQGKLDRIKSNDDRKFVACAEKGVGLCILDVSKVKYFKDRTSQPFLDIIERIIFQALGLAVPAS